MGRKSTVNLLPKAERTHPTSKVFVRPAEPAGPVEAPLPHQRAKSDTRTPQLDDESLNKVLQLAGSLATLRARNVNQQWRRVATDILNRIRYLQFSSLFPDIPTSVTVQSTLALFPKIENIVIRDWPYTHVYPSIADELVFVDLPCLKEIELLGVCVTPKTIATLVEKGSVRALSMGDHDSVNSAVISEVIKLRRDGTENGRDAKYLLDRLDLRRARCLHSKDITSLSNRSIAQELVVVSCPNVRVVSLSAVSLSSSRRNRLCESYSLTSCQSLEKVRVHMETYSNDCSHLNFSQSTLLSYLSFIPDNPPPFEFSTVLSSDLRELNLSGCRWLYQIHVQRLGPVVIQFPRLEKLILFGARRLQGDVLRNLFRLSATVPVLPKLVRLDLNGTQIDKLILNGYQQLAWVDVSGCRGLKSIDVRECWRLQSFSVLGKRIPLESVSMVLPVDCKVEGRRESWHWQIQGSHQAISYP